MKQTDRLKCPDCLEDSLVYFESKDSLICNNSWCNNIIRWVDYQTALPTDREMEMDQIQPDRQEQQREPFFMKSFGDSTNYYEDSVNLNLVDKDVKYHGSAGDAIRADNANRDREIAKQRLVQQQRRQQFTSSIVGLDSQETQLNQWRSKKIKESQERY